MSNYFFHHLTRKYIVIIGNLFNGLKIQKPEGEYIIPINYIDKDKLMQMVMRREKSFKGFSLTMPRISYTFDDMHYNPSRKLNRIHKYVNGLDYVYTPVPYDISVEMNVIANRTKDITQIVEQILPNFTPDIKITSNILSELDIKFDLSLNLNNIWLKDNYEGQLIDKRFIVYTFDFTFQTYFFNRVVAEEEDKIIYTATGNLYENLTSNTVSESVTAFANNEIIYE